MRWWRDTVHRKGGERWLDVQVRGHLPAPDATSKTGITKQMVSRWRGYLAADQIDDYRQRIIDKAYKEAFVTPDPDSVRPIRHLCDSDSAKPLRWADSRFSGMKVMRIGTESGTNSADLRFTSRPPVAETLASASRAGFKSCKIRFQSAKTGQTPGQTSRKSLGF